MVFNNLFTFLENLLFRVDTSQALVSGFATFESDLKQKIEGVRDEIKERKNKLVRDVQDFEGNLSKEDANRHKNSRGRCINMSRSLICYRTTQETS